jgi:cytochrome c556
MRFGNRTTPFVVVFAICAFGFWLTCPADEPPVKDRGVRPFMRQKLEASTRILEGLTTEKFRLISEGARTLKKMSTAERWRVTNDALYSQYSAEFTQRVERLEEKANAGNIDGAMLAWVECEMSCVRCHNHARAIKIVVH